MPANSAPLTEWEQERAFKLPPLSKSVADPEDDEKPMGAWQQVYE